jgi:Na+-transporting methylmalonyl-CoA/oxaloacetate decarboxylase gamma subunit
LLNQFVGIAIFFLLVFLIFIAGCARGMDAVVGREAGMESSQSARDLLWTRLSLKSERDPR